MLEVALMLLCLTFLDIFSVLKTKHDEMVYNVFFSNDAFVEGDDWWAFEI